MKIVTREEFIKMPDNILYSKYEPCFFGELAIKGKSWENDFLVQQIRDSIKNDSSDEFVELLDRAEKEKISIEMDFDIYGRDGCFDDKLFAIWEKKDIKKLINRLMDCL